MMKKRVTKGNVINCLCEKSLKACWIIVDVISCLCCSELCNVMKMIIFSSFVWTCHLHYFDTWLWQVLCALRKNENLKRMYNFEGCIARRDGYYISRDVSRAAMVIIEDRVVHRDRCIDRYVPHESQTERQRVCITRSDMHYYTWHCITHTYHWWTWYCVLLILWLTFCEICDWWILSLLLRICNLLNCCCWGYVICWSVVIEDM